MRYRIGFTVYDIVAVNLRYHMHTISYVEPKILYFGHTISYIQYRIGFPIHTISYESRCLHAGRVGGVARGRRSATRDPRPRPKPATRDQRPVRPVPCPSHSPRIEHRGAPRGARHSHVHYHSLSHVDIYSSSSWAAATTAYLCDSA